MSLLATDVAALPHMFSLILHSLKHSYRCRSLGLKFAPCPCGRNALRNLLALGRHQPLYIPIIGSQGPKFLVNSRLKYVCCVPLDKGSNKSSR